MRIATLDKADLLDEVFAELTRRKAQKVADAVESDWRVGRIAEELDKAAAELTEQCTLLMDAYAQAKE